MYNSKLNEESCTPLSSVTEWNPYKQYLQCYISNGTKPIQVHTDEKNTENNKETLNSISSNVNKERESVQSVNGFVTITTASMNGYNISTELVLEWSHDMEVSSSTTFNIQPLQYSF